jgi:hypothetical protein
MLRSYKLGISRLDAFGRDDFLSFARFFRSLEKFMKWYLYSSAHCTSDRGKSQITHENTEQSTGLMRSGLSNVAIAVTMAMFIFIFAGSFRSSKNL